MWWCVVWGVQLELERLRFFARPKLALDAVGGDSALRLAEALADVRGQEATATTTGRSRAWLGEAGCPEGQGGSGEGAV